MDFFSLSFFLHERTHRWFFRGTDDTIMNFRRLPSYLQELESAFDPLKDRILRGDCVIYNNSPVYIQGGAGWLCSRAAARLIFGHLRTFLAMWSVAEDTTFGPFLDVIGIGVRNSCSGAFMGHGPAAMLVAVSGAMRPNTVTCPPRNRSNVPIPRPLERLRDLFVFHKKDNVGKKLQITIRRAESVFNADPRVRWFTQDNFWPKACVDNS
jgi:hypothetical protein